MKYPVYPQYKDSGVAWLGEVPEHWDVKRLKMAAHLCDKKVEANEENPLPYIGMENIESWSGKLLPVDPDIVPSGIANYFSIGTILFGKLRPYLAKACNPDFDGLCSTELLVIQAEDFDRRALLYWLLADGFIKLVDSSTYGSKMPRANWDFIGNCELPVPPLTEQTVISDFLDRETKRIDTLVAKKRKLVALLKEKRSALISRTVTRGLPADAAREFGLATGNSAVHEAPGAYGRCRGEKFFAPTEGNDNTGGLKDSGVEWLGEIPFSWDVVPLRFLITIKGGATPDKSNSEYWEGDIPWVSPKDMKITKISDAQDHISSEALHNSALVLLPVNSVLIVVRGMILAHSFPVAITTKPVTINQDMKALICGSTVQAGYLAWFLMGLSRILVSLADESAHGTRKLETETLMNFPVLIPPLAEQTAIAAYLDRETAKIDRLVEKVETAIARLQEYRSALITAAVTGKIDLRGVTQ